MMVLKIDSNGRFSGYAAVFNTKDAYDDIFMPGAFAKTIRQKKPVILWQHESSEPIGLCEAIKEDGHGLHIEARLLVDAGVLERRVTGLIAADVVTGLSVGFRLVGGQYSTLKGAFLIEEADLWEISLVTFPAHEGARVSCGTGTAKSYREAEDNLSQSLNDLSRLFSRMSN